MRRALIVLAVAACSNGGGGHATPDAPMQHGDAPNLPHDAQVFLDAPVTGLCGNPGTGAACTEANWSFVALSGDARTATPTTACSAQFDTAMIIGRPTDASGEPTGACDPNTPTDTCMVDLYDCTASTGTQILTVGRWLDEVQITDHNGTAIYATSLVTYFGTLNETDTAVANVDFVTNGGYFRAHWTTSACAGGANRRVLISTPISVDEFACEDGAGPYNYSARLPAGALDVTARLYDATGDLGALDTKNIAIGDQSVIVDTGGFTFGL